MRLSYIQPSCVDFFAQFQWLVVGLVFTKVLSHHRVPVFHVGLAVPFFRTSVVHMLHLFSPAVCAALPMTSQTLVNEAEGCNTIKQFGVRVFIIKKTCNLQTNLLSLGTGLHVSGDSTVQYLMRVRRVRMLFFRCGRMALPCPSSTEVRTQPCHSQGGNKRTEHEESRRVFGPAGPQFSRPANLFRNAVTECRCESCVSACKVPAKS